MTAAAPTVAEALAQARDRGVDRLDAQRLLEHLLQRPRSWLVAHDDAVLPPAATAAWPALLARRAAGEPLAYVVGVAVFAGLTLAVTPAVLIPRPETEVLVDWAVECLADAPSRRVVDLGTGSGAVALAIRARVADAQVLATDASEAALGVAAGNAQRLGLAVELAGGDWWQAVGGRTFGLAVANPPYVAAGDPHLAALTHEPPSALTPGGDGMAALRRVIGGAPAHLERGAWLLVEHGHDQADAVRDALRAAGLADTATRCDLAGLPRCSGARARRG